MSTEIDVRKVMNEREKLFLKAQGPDKMSAAERLAATERIFEEWFHEINRTNLRNIPTSLANLYEDAAITLCMILTEERNIVTRN